MDVQPDSGVRVERSIPEPTGDSPWRRRKGRQRKRAEQSVGYLVIEGERKAPAGFDKNAFTQLAYGKFYTALTLPAGLDVDHVSCRLGNGILEIQVPISEASKPKQIQIQTGEDRKALHA